MSAYIEECARLYDKYHMGEDMERYVDDLRRRRFVDIPFVEMTVTTKCNLRCRCCSNLIPYLPRQEHIPLLENIDNLKRLLDNVHRIYRLKIHGGEPLSYPYLEEFLQFALQEEKIIDVRISTNGSIIPSASLLNIMKNPKFVLHISGYPFMKKKAACLMEVLHCSRIRYYYMEEQTWCCLGDYRYRKERSRTKTMEMISECNMRKCTSYYHGKIFVCSWAANRFAILGKEDGIEIKNDGMQNDIYDFYEQKYFECCSYCNGITGDSPVIIPGEQLERRPEGKV